MFRHVARSHGADTSRFASSTTMRGRNQSAEKKAVDSDQRCQKRER